MGRFVDERLGASRSGVSGEEGDRGVFALQDVPAEVSLFLSHPLALFLSLFLPPEP